MEKDRIEMTQRERDVLKVMALVLDGKRTQVEAGRLLRLSVRQVRRIHRRLEKDSDRGVVHRLRGQPSNHRTDPVVRQQVVELYKVRYMGFGPTFASEKLAADGFAVSDETLRNWLLDAKIWQPKRQRDVHRQRRDRRECFGELVQADGSHHDWLEGRGPRMVLVVMIDDATSKVSARFYPGETTEAYMDLLGRYMRKHGRMVAMYVDRDSIFRAEKHDPYEESPGMTQFKRAMNELEIGLILAQSPQAKGRVERCHQTAQDRLVKELRLAGANNIDQANDVLEKVFLPWFNRRCTVKPASVNNAHRPLHQSMNLSAILSIQDKRKVTNDYTIRLNNMIYQILPPALPGLRGGCVTIEHRLDGSMHVRFKGQYLKYKLCGPSKASVALPPNPRSLSHGQTPADRNNNASRKKEGQADATAGPCAVRLTDGCSGRTPAVPCPSKCVKNHNRKLSWRPPAEHPWRKFKLKRQSKKPDISTLVK